MVEVDLLGDKFVKSEIYRANGQLDAFRTRMLRRGAASSGFAGYFRSSATLLSIASAQIS